MLLVKRVSAKSETLNRRVNQEREIDQTRITVQIADLSHDIGQRSPRHNSIN